MKVSKYSKEQVSFSYMGTTVSANGALAKVVTYSFALCLLLVGIAAIRNRNNK